MEVCGVGECIKRKQSPQGGYRLNDTTTSVIATIDIMELGAAGWMNHSLTFNIAPIVVAGSPVGPANITLYGFRSGKRLFLGSFIASAPYDVPTFEWYENLDLIQMWAYDIQPAGSYNGVIMTYTYTVTP